MSEESIKVKIFKHWPRWPIITGAIIVGIAVVLFFSLLIYQQVYGQRFYLGAGIAGVDLGGQTKDSARQLVQAKIDSLKNGINFTWQSKAVNINPLAMGASLDAAVPLVGYNLDETIDQAYNLGRQGNYFTQAWQQLSMLIIGERLALSFDLDETRSQQLLQDGFADIETPARDAALKINSSSAYYIEDEAAGSRVDYGQALADFKNRLAQADNSSIAVNLIVEQPKIVKTKILNLQARAEKVLQLAPLTLTYQDQEWQIKKTQLIKWLGLYVATSTDEVSVGLNEELIKHDLITTVAPKVNQPTKEARFSVAGGGQVQTFQVGANGLELDLAASAAAINQAVKNSQNKIALIAKAIPTDVLSNDVSGLHIQEIIGTGKSNFVGSPSNRRHNIAVGAAAVNGVLVKPGDEFSLVKAIGNVDGSTGYLPELVIKENKTLPEFGGGLCQVGTTMFRAALGSGLPITARRNHSYRVGYYEPAGTDATIYIPQPDMRWLNDTGNYILIQTRISGNELIFDFWGTRDGRQIYQSKPVIYNIVKPAPAKIVETTSLKPGVKKCTEKAHNGADAYFDYKVTYPDGTVKDKRFSSHYVPWQEVCLLGVSATSSVNIASSTKATTTLAQ